MAFFTDPEITVMTKLLEIVYIAIGFICLYTAGKNLTDKENPSPYGTAVFWGSIGIVIAFGRWIPDVANGVLLMIMSGRQS